MPLYRKRFMAAGFYVLSSTGPGGTEYGPAFGVRAAQTMW